MFTPVTLTTPVTAVDGYSTRILVDDCPDTMTAPSGTVHNADVAFNGSAAIEYDTCRMGQDCTFVAVMNPGLAGILLVSVSMRVELLPQAASALAVILPVVNSAVKLTIMIVSLMPGPFGWVTLAPTAGTVQV